MNKIMDDELSDKRNSQDSSNYQLIKYRSLKWI